MPLFKGAMCKSAARLNGKTVIITGANTGIGKETVKDLLERGARIIVACRDVNKAKAAVDDIAGEDPAKKSSLVVRKLDLASLASIRQFATEILENEPKIDILINNAGVMMCPEMKTEDGFEMQFGTNHLGHFLLTNLLLERIKQSTPARIVIVSSLAHENGKIFFDNLMLDKAYGPIKSYCQSKLANVLFAKELARRLQGTNVTVYSLHPGAVHTELMRHFSDTTPFFVSWASRNFGATFLKTPIEGAQTTIYCAVAEELADRSGYYYSDCKEKQPSSRARKEETAKRLWDVSCSLVGIENEEVIRDGAASASS